MGLIRLIQQVESTLTQSIYKHVIRVNLSLTWTHLSLVWRTKFVLFVFDW